MELQTEGAVNQPVDVISFRGFQLFEGTEKKDYWVYLRLALTGCSKKTMESERGCNNLQVKRLWGIHFSY